MDRRNEQLGSDDRREWIEVRFVADGADSTLRGRVWAVGSYPSVDARVHDQNPIEVAPAEVTLADAREVLQQCGHR
jgi:hypothetical protein